MHLLEFVIFFSGYLSATVNGAFFSNPYYRSQLKKSEEGKNQFIQVPVDLYFFNFSKRSLSQGKQINPL